MKPLNLYLISQDVATGYDSYDSAVVAAVDASMAASMHPRDGGPLHPENELPPEFDEWARFPEQVHVALIGIADASIDRPSVICASYNAG